MYTIISGTNRPGSTTIKIAGQYQQLLAEKNIQATLVTLENLDVSARNPAILQLENDVMIPSDKFIFVSPEYNGSFPGVLKCFIDYSDIRKVWWGKKALLTGISSGRAGNIRGMEHLTGILHYVKVVVHPNKLPISVIDTLVNEEGYISDPLTLKIMRIQVDEFTDF